MRFSSLLLGLAFAVPSLAREHTDFDLGWRFSLGNASDPTLDFNYGLHESFAKAGFGVGPLSGSFDDSGWREVNVPHDWAVELPFVPGGAPAHAFHGFKPVGKAYPATTIGWYRKSFELPAGDKGKRLSLQFDGVFRDAQVWVNGHYMTRNLSGYTPFSVDLTDIANVGGRNTVCVRVDASQYEGWFYEGAGIYRHVWLDKAAPAHFSADSFVVRPTVTGSSGSIQVEATVANDSDEPVRPQVTVSMAGSNAWQCSLDGPALVQPHTRATYRGSKAFPKPRLWSVDTPHLYAAEASLKVDGRQIDSAPATFGFRTVEFTHDRGMLLNGKRVEVKGACCHQDHAGVGAAVPDSVNEWRIAQLKKWGFNALRTSHNPPTAELLDACDRLGMVVMDETRAFGSGEEALAQLRTLVARDRNHPSIVAWSIGNEEPEATTDRGGRIATTMMREIKALDPTRFVTYASNAGNNPDGANARVTLRGFNYKKVSDIDKYHREHPLEKLWGSEEASALSTRGEYANDPQKGYMASYDINEPGWGATAEDWWTFYDARPFLAGAFVWTGFDYRGEPTPYRWPCISSHFGVLDTCGFPKDTAYYYKSWWTDEPTLHVFPHWNWPGMPGKPIEVWVHSNLPEVELFLNGKSLGRKAMKKDGHLAWTVPYQPGTLLAKGFRGNGVALTTSVETTGATTQLALAVERDLTRADGKDVGIVTVRGLDAKGRVNPLASENVSLSVTGGRIIGVGNGDPSCHEPDQYFAEPTSRTVGNWRWKPFSGARSKEWDSSKFDDSGWQRADASGEAEGMAPNTFAVYRTVVDGPFERLSVGQMDDEGWVYLNGKEVIHGTDWDASYNADVKALAVAGKNVVVVVVKNNAGRGGIGRGVRVSSAAPQPAWSRSLFHGLAQVLVVADPGSPGVVLRASAKNAGGAEVRLAPTRR